MVFTTNTYINKSTILNERLEIKDEIMKVQNAFKQNYSKKYLEMSFKFYKIKSTECFHYDNVK